MDQRQIVFYGEKYAVRSRAKREAALFKAKGIIDIYRGLWRVEGSFGITKDELETRPLFLSREDRIRAHFLICYIALVIVRLIQKRTGRRHTPEKLIEAMNGFRS